MTKFCQKCKDLGPHGSSLKGVNKKYKMNIYRELFAPIFQLVIRKSLFILLVTEIIIPYLVEIL